MIERRSFLRLLSAGAAAAVLAPLLARAAEAPAVDTVNTFYATLIEVMKQAKTLGFQGRYEKLDPAMHRAFNLPLMARLAIGPDWQKLSSAEQSSLTTAFGDFSVSTYANRFDGYSGQRFEVSPDTTSSAGGVIVSTKLIENDGNIIELNYLLRDGEGGWQIIDVFLKGTVSELATRRAEFSTVLRNEGADALLKLIQKRTADLKKPA
ncbi:MAG TPA: ABC transporter substrate-binding protein [Stellaceae bacterium]|nr:ABC transporter substrate-binding protein [Stellaceae bacterium]